MMIKHAMLVLAAALAASSGSYSFAKEAWPDTPVKMVVPYSPGGTTDFAGRLIAQKLTEQTGQTFFVENKAGASGTIGTDQVVRSAPDGSTFLVNDTSYAMIPHLKKSLPWKPDQALIPVTTIMKTPLVLVVSKNSPYTSIGQLIDAAHKTPDEITYGSGGVGSSTHLGAELFANVSGIKIRHIPYKGAGEAMLALISGQVDLEVTAAPTAIPQIKGGKVRALAVTSDERLSLLPDVPTTAEVGLKDFNAQNWFGIAAPKGTPEDIIRRMQAGVARALESPDLASHFAELGAVPVAMPTAEFQSFVKAETDKWGKLIHAAGIQPQ